MTNAMRALSTAALTALFAALSALAAASGLQVDPLSLTVTAYGDIAVTNTGSDALRVAINAYDWTQNVAEQRHVEATDKVAYFPKIFTLVPGQTQRVRVGVDGAAGTVERAFRLFVTELPPLAPQQSGGSPRLQVLTRIDIPVFQAGPAAANAVPRIDHVAATPTGVRIVIGNDGGRHLAPSKIAVSGRDASGATVWSAQADEWYVLAKSERSADLDLPAETCRKIRSFDVRWTVGDRTVDATLSNGICR